MRYLTTEDTVGTELKNKKGQVWTEDSGITLTDWIRKGGALQSGCYPYNKLILSRINEDGTMIIGEEEGGK